MNATKRSAARAGLVVCSVLAVAVAGCQTPVVHERTVYLPAPPPPVVDVPPAPAPEPPPPVVVAPPAESTPVVVIQSENDFYAPLAAYGRWEVVGAYGRCWIPARVEAGWRPYSNGYWQRTDAGWYWASDEPWGWATYHYGRWDFDTRFGWVWVPQTQWAPAWVAWREGGGYVGWAPLRPSVTIGVNINVGDYEPAFASRAFVFVEHRRMLEPVRPQTVIVNNTTIINKTVNITKVKVVNKTVINEGPRLEVVERESGRKVQSVSVREFRHREEATVAARERNIPTTKASNAQPRVHNEPRPVQPSAPSLREVRVVGKAPVFAKSDERAPQPAQPIAQVPHARPEVAKPARDNDERKPEVTLKPRAQERAVEAKAKPETRPERGVPSRAPTRAIDKPAEVAKPAPVRASQANVQTQHRQATERVAQATTRTDEARSRDEGRKASRVENRPSSRVESPRPAPAKRQVATAVREQIQRPQPSSKQDIRAAERAETNKKNREEKEQKKKGED